VDDLVLGLAVDAAGNAYVTGDTTSTEATFPVAVGPDLTHNEATDGFVARVNAAGTVLDYCGYIGGSNSDWSWRIAVDAAGNAYVMGFTRSDEATFPVNVGPDLSYNGGPSYGDAFVARVAAAGTALDYCGYIGGSGDDFGWGIAVDADGNAYVTGQTDSSQLTFPVVVGPDLTYNGGFDDAFVAKVNAAGTALDYCGYIGGSGHEVGLGIAVDAAGRAYVTGQTDSSEATFPVVVGPDLTYNDDGEYGDAFVAKVNAAGTMLASCGYIGGWGVESGSSIAVDGACTAYVAGYIAADDAGFPVTIGPDLTYNGSNDAFVTKVHSSEFSLGATPSSFEICAGTEAEYTVTVGAICGFGNDVTLAASGNPAGSTTSFSVDPVPPPGSSVLTIGNTGGAAGGSYVVTIGGTADGSADLSVDVTLDVVVAPAPPSLTAPPDGATGQPLRPTFQWAVAAGADSYCLEVDDDLVFGSPAISETGILGTTFTPSSDLEENMIYYWRVRSENPCGCGAASTVFSFTTAGLSLPGEFAKIAPANGATGQPTDRALSWSTSTNAISYERCVDTTDNDACDTSWINVGDVTSTMLGGLVESTAYFWQVRAINGQGSTEADGGDWWWFITTPYLFSDGFESGDTSAWSVTMP
jgi:hypothetical protein